MSAQQSVLQHTDQEIVARFVTEKHADPAFADLLRNLSAPELAIVAKIIVTLSPSANTLRGYFDLSREIARRDDIEQHRILGSQLILGILAHDGWSRKEKQKRVREHLERLRYPWQAQRQTEILNVCQEVRRKYSTAIGYPPDLEGDCLTTTIAFRNVEELKSAVIRLGELAESEELSQIFRLLLGKE